MDTYKEYPVCLNRLINPLLLLTMHRGGGKPEFCFKWFKTFKSCIVPNVHLYPLFLKLCRFYKPYFLYSNPKCFNDF